MDPKTLIVSSIKELEDGESLTARHEHLGTTTTAGVSVVVGISRNPAGRQKSWKPPNDMRFNAI